VHVLPVPGFRQGKVCPEHRRPIRGLCFQFSVMPYISVSQHRKFCEYVSEKLEDFKSDEQMHSGYSDIEDRYRNMQALFDAYQKRLGELQEITQQYEKLKRETRILLRKKYMKHKTRKVTLDLQELKLNIS
jgi:hypothetical protein